jgi:hypothetical protein
MRDRPKQSGEKPLSTQTIGRALVARSAGRLQWAGDLESLPFLQQTRDCTFVSGATADVRATGNEPGVNVGIIQNIRG